MDLIQKTAAWQKDVQKASGLDSVELDELTERLIIEEHSEWEHAFESIDNEVKESADCIFVHIGRLVYCGYDPAKVYAKVVESNYSKLYDEKPTDLKPGEEAKPVADKWGIFKDGKLQKGSNYITPTFDECKM